MKYMSGNEIRKRFLKFFEDRGHLVLPSASLIPQDDPTLLLIGAGMAPFKPFFTGKMKPPSPRITTCQKCVRTGDIENVGRTARHHTYFEMLGDFSFGDYFKKEIIPWSWEFLTKELELPADKLWVTIHPTDDEAYEIWHNVVGVPDERIVRLEENFWETGSGPCGPDSELHIDMGEERGCGRPDCKPGCDCDRFLEIWNLVFTQYDQHEDGTYTPLANKNIDTGAGLERLASVLQGKPSNFETDLIFPIIEYAAKVAGVEYGKDKKTDVSLKVIAPHVLSITFMIADGVLPSNEGRGYVLRRVLRRAVRHARLIGIEDKFLNGAVDVVIDMFKEPYPYLVEKTSFIHKVIEMEETSVLRTLRQGCDLLYTEIESLKKENKTVLDGATAFRLSDTFGFPRELTAEILEEEGMTMDDKAFNEALEVQRKMARDARDDKTGRPVIYNTRSIDLASLKVDEGAQGGKILVGAQQWIGFQVVGRIVAVVGVGLKNGVQVNAGNAQLFQVRQLLLDARKIAAVIVHVQVAIALLIGPKIRLAGFIRTVNAVRKGQRLVGYALIKAVREDLVHRTVFDPVRGLEVRLVHRQLPIQAIHPGQLTFPVGGAVNLAEIRVQVKVVKVQTRRGGGDGKGKVVLLGCLARELHAVMHGSLAVLGQHQVGVHIAQGFRDRQAKSDLLPGRHRAKRRFAGGIQAVVIGVRHSCPRFG